MQQKSYSKINLFIRSSIFWFYSTVSIVLYSFVCVAAVLLPLKKRHALIRGFFYAYMFVLRTVCHINYEVEGLENIPKDHAAVVLSKHQSAWETFCLPLFFHSPAVIIKRELLWVPFFGWGLATSDPISIDRADKSSAMQQVINKGRACLEKGRFVIIFPEGTRVPAGQIGQYRLGGARLAVATGFPVIPVAHNAGRFWPKRTFLKIPGTIHLVIGKEIESKGRTPDELMRLTKTWIEDTVKRIDKQ